MELWSCALRDFHHRYYRMEVNEIVDVFCSLLCLIKQCCLFSETSAMSFPMQPLWHRVVLQRYNYISMVLWFFQAVHLTQEWREEELQTYFRRDTGCLNYNTSMKNCKFSFSTHPLSSHKKKFFKS